MVIINGRTMVPVRFISEALGAKVEWDGSTQTVAINTKQDLYTINLDKPTLSVYDAVNAKPDIPDLTNFPSTVNLGNGERITASDNSVNTPALPQYIPKDSGKLANTEIIQPSDFRTIGNVKNIANPAITIGALLTGIIGKIFTAAGVANIAVDTLNLSKIISLISDYPPSINDITLTLDFYNRQQYKSTKPYSWEDASYTYGWNGNNNYFTEIRTKTTLKVVNRNTGTTILNEVDDGSWKAFAPQIRKELPPFENINTPWGTITVYNH